VANSHFGCNRSLTNSFTASTAYRLRMGLRIVGHCGSA
jgi:hypothetical protein